MQASQGCATMRLDSEALRLKIEVEALFSYVPDLGPEAEHHRPVSGQISLDYKDDVIRLRTINMVAQI